MHIPTQLQCLFSATVEEHEDTFLIEVPEDEIHLGDLRDDETYRVALLPSSSNSGSEHPTIDPPNDSASSGPPSDSDAPKPPVEEGETRDVEIEDIGDQGDGLARVERGFVVVVPDTEVSERVTIEITDVRKTVAFADVVERLSYYD